MKLEDRWYTSTEVAQILGVSLRSVYRYLEENKLDAEIKTATGRHRFTKKNILDFLYPGSKTEDVENIDVIPSSMVNQRVQPVYPQDRVVVEEQPRRRAVPQPQVRQPHVPVPEIPQEFDEPSEPIDWLTKFRQAAGRVKSSPIPTPEPQQDYMQAPIKPQPQMGFSTETIKGGLSAADYADYEEPVYRQPEPRRRPTLETVYYRSSVGGLKDIAQNIDRSARKSFLEYAFTLQAGLSLHKAIRPFSVLHAYVKPKDRAFFERMLGLTPSDEHNAQLALLYTDHESIYASKREMHGLFVVSDSQLKTDILATGDSYLIGEVETLLPH